MDSENTAVSGIEGEEKPASGFVAKLQILNLPGIFCAGLQAVLHIGDVVEMNCVVAELMQQIDRKTRKPMKKKPVFVKSNAVVVCRIEVENIEELSDVFHLDPTQFGKCSLQTQGYVDNQGYGTIAHGIITDFPA